MPSDIVVTKVPDANIPAPINPDWITRGNPDAWFGAIHKSEDGFSDVVVWNCSPGRFTWHYDKDETMFVLEGHAVLQQGEPDERTVGPGEVVIFPAGAVVAWEVLEDFRKLAVIRRPMPEVAARAFNILRRLRNRPNTPFQAETHSAA